MKRRRRTKLIALLLALGAAALLASLLLGGPADPVHAPPLPSAPPSSAHDVGEGSTSVVPVAPGGGAQAAPGAGAPAAPAPAPVDARGESDGAGAPDPIVVQGAGTGAGLGGIDGVMVDPFGPVAGVAVTVGRADLRPLGEALTDAEGRFALDVPAGEWPVCVGGGVHIWKVEGVRVTAG